MKKSFILLLAVIAAGFSAASPLPAEDLPPELEAVKKYIMEEEYPELFGDQPYRTKMENALIVDLDGDGQDEVVALFHPHYRQSPFIVIYLISKKNKATRVREGLAPGDLVPVSGDYLDSHTLKIKDEVQSIDFDIGEQQGDPQMRAKMRDSALDKEVSLVEYRTFFHMDGRKGKGTYVDMTHVSNLPREKTCDSFEFARVKSISAGHVLKDKKRNYLAASVQKKLWIYRIDGISEKGILDKKLWIVPQPAGFRELLSQDDNIVYRDSKGKTKELDFNID
jgi:hypothetical protein